MFTLQTDAADALIILLLAGNPGGNDQLIREPHQLSSCCQWQGITLKLHKPCIPAPNVLCQTDSLLHPTDWLKSLG